VDSKGHTMNELQAEAPIVFGPVPSRRLGQSLGINNIPPKICSYACRYCQLGRTSHMSIRRRPTYAPELLVRQVQRRVEEVRSSGGSIDYLCFVPDGEPTLDLNLGVEIESLRTLGIRTGIISNASLIWQQEVQRELMDADWVSLKVDAVDEKTWKRIDRPHGKLELNRILDGLRQFAGIFKGRLVTETMLVRDLNDGPGVLNELAAFLEEIQPEIAYLSIPLRPPAEGDVRMPDEAGVTRAWSILSQGGIPMVRCRRPPGQWSPYSLRFQRRIIFSQGPETTLLKGRMVQGEAPCRDFHPLTIGSPGIWASKTVTTTPPC